MTIEEKKISLINWIKTLEDEGILDQISGLKKSSIDELPDAIIQLLKKAEEESEDHLIEHTSVNDLLNKR
jgi:hypothetical protein